MTITEVKVHNKANERKYRQGIFRCTDLNVLHNFKNSNSKLITPFYFIKEIKNVNLKKKYHFCLTKTS